MAIKEVAKSFALFLGYTMPDSSGSSDTILDQMDDGMSSINTGLEDAGKNIDKNKKKTKEWKNFLASFDVANVIPDQSSENSDTSGNSGSNGGTSGMKVDPRLLKALEDYDYLFGNIKMKATEIAKKITEWINKLNEGIKENIFEPIENSWNKYSPSILANVRETKNNIASILGGVIGVVEKKWKPFFQALSDLFFSLVDTVTNISSTITKLLKIIWDNGGKYLFDSLWDLATAFLELATSVNDNFVKPVINLIKKSVVPIFGTLLGKVLEVTGKIVKGFANVISWIAKSKTVTIILGSAFTALFLTIKIAKFIDLINKMKGTHTITKALIDVLYDHNKIFKKVVNAWISGESKIGKMKSALGALNKVISNTSVWSNIGSKIKNVGENFVSSGTKAGGLSGVLKTKLGGALTWLAANPVVAVIAGITGIIAVLAALGSKQKEKKYDMDDYSKSVQNQIKAVDGLKDSLKEAKESYNSAMQDAKANAEIAESALSKLDELGGATGIIDPSNAKEANNAMMLLNKSLGEEVVTIKNGKVEYQGSIDKIKERIKTLKEQAEEEAKYQLYVEYTKAKIKADNENKAAKESLIEKTKRLNELEEKRKNHPELIKSDDLKDIEQLKADIDGLNKTVDKSKEAMKNAEDGMKALDKTTKGMTDTTDKLSKKTAEFYASLDLSDEAALSFEELGNQMKATTKQLEESTKKGKKLTEQEKSDIVNAKKKIIEKYAEQAKTYKVTYEDMLKILKKQGIKLDKEEEKQLKESMSKTKKHGTNKKKEIESQNKTLLELLKKSNIDVNSEKGKNYKKELENAQKQGTKEGKKYLDNLSKELKTPAKAKVNVEGAEKEGKKAQQTLFSLISKTFFANVDTKNEGTAGKAANNTLTRFLVKTFTSTVRVSNADKAGSDAAGKIKNKTKDLPAILKSVIESAKVIQNKFNKKVKGVNMKATVTNIEVLESAKKALKSSISLALGMAGNWLGFKGYADGGYPDVGQMFIAREAGPELVGTMGGKTAVANNDQIVSGISSGVYQAVIQALRDGGSVQKQGGDIYITIQNPDGTSTTKIIRDYIKYMNHNGGKGGIPV